VALVGAGHVLSFTPARKPATYALGLLPVVVALIGMPLGSGGFTEDSFTKVRHSLDDLDRLQVVSARLVKQLQRDQDLVKMIPAGSMVFTHPLAARQLRKLHDIKFVRASRNHTGVDDMLDRTKDLSTLMNAKGPTADVQRLLAKYRIVYAIQKKDHPIRWLAKEKVIASSPSLKLIKLSPLPLRSP
jgi:hypothetical protein